MQQTRIDWNDPALWPPRLRLDGLVMELAALALDRARAAVRWRPWHHSC